MIKIIFILFPIMITANDDTCNERVFERLQNVIQRTEWLNSCFDTQLSVQSARNYLKKTINYSNENDLAKTEDKIFLELYKLKLIIRLYNEKESLPGINSEFINKDDQLLYHLIEARKKIKGLLNINNIQQGKTIGREGLLIEFDSLINLGQGILESVAKEINDNEKRKIF